MEGRQPRRTLLSKIDNRSNQILGTISPSKKPPPGPSGARKTTMIVALARKLLIALWRLVTTGEVPDGVELRPAA